MGDLYLSGYKNYWKSNLFTRRTLFNKSLLRKVFQDNENFSIIEIKEKNVPHAFINKNS